MLSAGPMGIRQVGVKEMDRPGDRHGADFLERLSQLEQITFLNCPRSEERVGGFLAFRVCDISVWSLPGNNHSSAHSSLASA